MATNYWLVLPPRLRRQGLPLLARSRGLGIAPIVRNDFGGTRELIARDARPVAPAARGGDFGPVDDLLLVRPAARVDGAAASRLLADFDPTPRQLVAALVLGLGPAAGRWAGLVWDEGLLRPLLGLTLVGPRMARLAVAGTAAPSPDALERWSRTRGALGEATWRRVRDSRVAVVGAGRNGSAAALGLAMLGVSRLVLIDGDLEERHNLDATVGATPEGVGRPKVENRLRTLAAIRPDDLEVVAVPRPLRHAEAAEALRGVDLVVTCVDRDAARLEAARLANRWAKLHLDVGTGVFGAGRGRRMGGDVRLLLPGEACVNCLGGLRGPETGRAELEASGWAMRRGPRPEWHAARAGSLVTLNQIAVNLGLQAWLELLAGRRTTSCWLRLAWDGEGGPSLVTAGSPAARCRVCREEDASRGAWPV